MVLSDADKARVKSDWAKVVPDTDVHGLGYYQKLIGENPHYHQMFKFADVKVEDFPGNQAIRTQARRVFMAVGKCVGWMDTPEDMKKRMAVLAGTHKGYGLVIEDFDVGFGVLLSYLAGALGLDESGVTAWTNFVADLRAAVASNY